MLPEVPTAKRSLAFQPLRLPAVPGARARLVWFALCAVAGVTVACLLIAAVVAGDRAVAAFQLLR